MTEFMQHTISGKVHAVIDEDEREAWWAGMRQRRPLYQKLFPPDHPRLPTPARCGTVAHPGWGELPPDLIGFVYVDVFDDGQLCTLCWRATPPAERDELLEHAVPVDLDALEASPR